MFNEDFFYKSNLWPINHDYFLVSSASWWSRESVYVLRSTLQRWCKMLLIVYSTKPFINSGQPLRSKIQYQEKDVKKRVTYDPKIKQGTCFYKY